MYKLLHVITCLATGGAEKTLYNLLAAGLARSFDNAVVSLSNKGAIGHLLEELGVPVHCLNMAPFRMSAISRIAELRRIVRSVRPHVVHGWMYHGNLAACLAGRLGEGSPAVTWNIRQCLYDLKPEKFLTRQVIRANRFLSGKVGAVIYNCELARIQHEAFGFASAHGHVIPNRSARVGRAG